MNELGQKLGLDQSALAGMIEFWVRKGRLKVDQQATMATPKMCASGSCSCSCPGPKQCPFVMKMPQSYSLVSRE